jgi:hypothetical protein
MRVKLGLRAFKEEQKIEKRRTGMKELLTGSKKDLRPVLQVGRTWLIQEVVFTFIMINGEMTNWKLSVLIWKK